MNREIKFRAWFDKDSKEHNYILEESKMEYDIEIDSKGRFLAIERDWDIYNRFTIPIMQYTGLKDKNGVDIYEGDIVRLYDGFGQKIKDYIIKWNDRGAYEYFSTNKDSFHIAVASIDTYSLDYVGVIGNIYENPELLEEIDNGGRKK